MKIQDIEKNMLQETPKQEEPKSKITIDSKKILKAAGKGLLIAGLAPIAITLAIVAASGRRGRRGNRRR